MLLLPPLTTRKPRTFWGHTKWKESIDWITLLNNMHAKTIIQTNPIYNSFQTCTKFTPKVKRSWIYLYFTNKLLYWAKNILKLIGGIIAGGVGPFFSRLTQWKPTCCLSHFLISKRFMSTLCDWNILNPQQILSFFHFCWVKSNFSCGQHS